MKVIKEGGEMNGDGEPPRIQHELDICEDCGWGGSPDYLLSDGTDMYYCPYCECTEFKIVEYWSY